MRPRKLLKSSQSKVEGRKEPLRLLTLDFRFLLAFFLAILFFPLSAQGQQTRVYGTREVPTVDTTVVQLVEEFASSGLVTTGNIGTHNWSIRNIGAAPTLAFQDGVFPNLGILRVTTPAVIVQGGNLALDNANPLGILGANGNWDSTWVFRINQNVTIRFRIGYEPSGGVAAQPANGLWLRFDTSAGFADANWQFCARAAAGAETCFNTAVAANTNWHRVRIRSGNAGVIHFSLDGGTERCIAVAGCDANGALPAVALSPGMIVVSDLAVTARSADVDFWGFVAINLNR